MLNFSSAIFSRLQEKKKQAGGKNVDEPLKKEQVFQCEASGNEVGGKEGSVPDAENKVPAGAFDCEDPGSSNPQTAEVCGI